LLEHLLAADAYAISCEVDSLDAFI